MQKEQILKKLLELLQRKFNLKINYGDYNQNRQIFRGICNQLPPMNMDKEFYELQDKLLGMETNTKQLIEVDDLKFINNIAHVNGDITTFKADVIVNAANDEYLGCFIPCHNCIDNVIMSASGFQMRNELYELKKQKDYNTQRVKVTKGYNLPCKYVFHIAGPIIYSDVKEKDKIELSNCYKACLKRAKEMKFKNIVSCCISTGEYHFPNALACQIAVDTVKEWLKDNDCNLKVVFDTYKVIDKELYDARLSKED